MEKLKREDLYTLEEYARRRPEFRAQVLAHKQNRQLPLGPNATLYFEDRLTMQYQIQEMLRVERIFEPEGIQDELNAYNPLIPDGTNWKVTFMLEYPDIEERRRALQRLKGIEDMVWVRVEGQERVYPIADEDLERENETKTSSVHFLRFELTPAMIRALKNGASLAVGVDHPEYRYTVDPVPERVRDAIVRDLHDA
ncbi:MAG TPA: DUF3501 family protein [Burkholderiales bacterium]